jgi:thiamine-monophosphate kinase
LKFWDFIIHARILDLNTTMVNRRPVNEDSILRQIRNWCNSTHLNSTMFGIGDDAAAIQPSGRPILFCSDMTLQNEHFDLDFSTAADVGHKALARVLSDLAAMGSQPLGVTISIALPKTWQPSTLESFLEHFYEGAVSASKLFKAPIVGGDLTRVQGPITIDVAAIGETREGSRPWRRAGACPRDLVFVTGSIGAAAFALDEMRQGKLAQLSYEIAAKHLRPVPRFDVAERFSPYPVHAAIDISDGLVRDAFRLCVESNISMVIDETKIPLMAPSENHEDKSGRKRIDCALYGGDDYELILIIAADWAESLFGATELRAIGASLIGKIEASSSRGNPEVYLTSEEGARRLAASMKFAPLGYDPFRDA